jgi:hypothetical protein
MPKFNVRFTAALPARSCGGALGGRQERSENLYAADALEAEQKARRWWDVVKFHGAAEHAKPKPAPRARRKKEAEDDEL